MSPVRLMVSVLPVGVLVLVVACWSEGPELPGGEADGICAAAPCSDIVSIDVTRRDEGLFPPGAYTFTVEIESGNPVTEQCALNDAASLSCSGAADVSVRLSAEFDRFVVTVSDTSPEQLVLRVSYESTVIGEELLKPEYQYISDADPDCGITCIQGTAALGTAAP